MLFLNFTGAWLIMFVLNGLTTFHPSYSQTLGLLFVFLTLVDFAHPYWDLGEVDKAQLQTATSADIRALADRFDSAMSNHARQLQMMNKQSTK